MESKTMTMVAVAIMLTALIQMVVAPQTEEPKVESKKLNLFKDKDNYEKLALVFAAACKSETEAKKKIKEYKDKGGLSKDLEDVLNDVAKSPKNMYSSLVKPITKELDQKLSKYMIYGVCVKPIWHVVKGAGCAALRLFGVSVYTTGQLIQLVNAAAKESMNAAGQKPTAEVKEAMGQIHDAGGAVKDFGSTIEEKAKKGMDKTTQIASGSPPNSGPPASGYPPAKGSPASGATSGPPTEIKQRVPSKPPTQTPAIESKEHVPKPPSEIEPPNEHAEPENASLQRMHHEDYDPTS